jgi:peptidoglycan/LPS O-acetylase OafA/YrhL
VVVIDARPMSGNSASRLQFIDSLRLLAAVLVLAQHVLERHREIAGFDAFVHLGPGLIGVIIFFLVSGYVVPMSGRDPFRPVPFMVRRVFRIYPLLLSAFALVFLLGVTGILERWSFMAQAGPAQWAANLMLSWGIFGFQPFLGVAWALVIEFVWYVLFAATYARWGDRAGLVLAAALPAGLLVLTAGSYLSGIRLPLGLANMVYACVLGYLAYLHDRKVISGRLLALNLAGFFVVNWLSSVVAYGVYGHQDVSLGQVLWAWPLGLLAFFGVVLWPRLRTARLLNHGLLPAVGAASYSVYLLHPLGLAAGEQYTNGVAGDIAVVLAISAVLALIGYRYVELPGIALGRRVSALIERPRAVPAAAQG